ncbi:glycosyltransferase family 4 protein [Bremerella sp. JC817]|uniref:glycosyltransferase family 4 protein n=1 Tax=Bremerella sp. JC817 TaxID=3231756 RepID=UPI003459E7EC
MPLVVYLCEYGTIYGGENSMLAGLEEIKRRGFDVAVACPGESLLSRQLARRQVRHISFTWTDAQGKRLPLELLRDQLNATIPAWHADIVHANSLSVSRILGPCRRPEDCHFVGHLRDIIKLNRRVVEDISALDEIYCVSTATREHHLRQGLREENSQVLHNGIDLQQFSPPASRPDRRPLQLVYIGQLVMRKGIDTLLQSVHLAVEAGVDVALDLYGECHSEKDEALQYVAQQRRWVETVGMISRIRFRGRTHHPIQILQEANVLVHAARQEPWGRVLIEGAACGIPIVATDVGGTREMFPSEEAILVPPDDPEAMAEAIVKLYHSAKLRELVGAKARQRIEQFGISGYADKLAGRYEKLVRGPVK